MDYARIYRDFIADRRQQELGLKGYVERHHILPRSLGGSDEAENLIRLTPEDHFFAHLLLAKIHGGTMWAPVAFMVGGSRKDYKPTRSRKKYGWVRRALSKSLRGVGCPHHDRAVHSLRHVDGREWRGLQMEMVGLGLSKPLANMLVKGRINTAKGWYLAKHDSPPTTCGSSHPMYRPETYRFRHKDGREMVGTQFDLHTRMGVSKSGACRLARGKAKSWAGWAVVESLAA